MHVFVRNSLLGASLLLAASAATAEYHGITLPAAPQGAGGEDSIETPGGTRCRQSLNSSGAYVDFGAAGIVSKPLESQGAGADAFRFYSESRDQTGMLYGRVTIPLGKKPKRIDCSRVYELEIERLQAEVAMLKMAAE
jgi:hypothetical protein